MYNERVDFTIAGPFDDHVVHIEFFDHDMIGHDGACVRGLWYIRTD